MKEKSAWESPLGRRTTSYCVLVRERGHVLTHKKWGICARGSKVSVLIGGDMLLEIQKMYVFSHF